jgi:hypothetical protein
LLTDVCAQTRSKTGHSKPRVFEAIPAPEPASRKKAGGVKKKAAAPKVKKAAPKKESKPKIKKTVAGKVSKAKKDVKKTVNGATKKVCLISSLFTL